jgi:phosphoglycerate dehydrogenase-like enzyme
VTFDELSRSRTSSRCTFPLVAETKNLFGAATFAKMKKGSYLINCARGGVVDEDAVLEALTSGQLAGAALDVFGKEPPEPAPLFKHET